MNKTAVIITVGLIIGLYSAVIFHTYRISKLEQAMATVVESHKIWRDIAVKHYQGMPTEQIVKRLLEDRDE